MMSDILRTAELTRSEAMKKGQPQFIWLFCVFVCMAEAGGRAQQEVCYQSSRYCGMWLTKAVNETFTLQSKYVSSTCEDTRLRTETLAQIQNPDT